MNFFTRIGTGEVYILVIIIIVWCWNYRLGVRLALLITFSGAVNGLLKTYFHAPRPYVGNPTIIRYSSRTATTFGMPSGHAQTSVTFWSYLMQSYKRTALWIAGIIIIICIGISRIYLGSHSMSQVLAGWAIGLILAIAFFRFKSIWKAWAIEQHPAVQAIGSFVIGLFLILVNALTILFQNTSAEADHIAQQHLSDIIGLSALFSGFAIGYVLLRRQGRIRVQVVWWKQAIKLGICALSLLVFLGISEILEIIGELSLPGRLYIFLAYMLLGLIVTYLAPLLFLKLNLAEEEQVDL